MNRTIAAGLCALAAAQGARAAAPAKKAATPVKVSSAQLFLRLDTIDKRLEEIQKAQEASPKGADAAASKETEEAIKKAVQEAIKASEAAVKTIQEVAAKAAAAPALVQQVGPSAADSAAAKNLAQALYNAGMYHRRAKNLELTGWLVRDLTLVAGVSLMGVAWFQERDPGLARQSAKTIPQFFKYYPRMSAGVLSVLTGTVVAEFIGWGANRAEVRAADALKRPLEILGQAPAPSSPGGAPQPKP